MFSDLAKVVVEFVGHARAGLYSSWSTPSRKPRKTLDPGVRRGDDGNFTVGSITTVIPAQAGIQRR
jgi:hypothetical protein